jgi:hypothetical protein
MSPGKTERVVGVLSGYPCFPPDACIMLLDNIFKIIFLFIDDIDFAREIRYHINFNLKQKCPLVRVFTQYQFIFVVHV